MTVAWLSFGMSVLALALSAYIAKRQHDQWLEINRPRLRFDEPRLEAFRELRQQTLEAVDWGYDDPLVAPVTERHVVQDRYRIYTELVLWKPKEGGRLLGLPPLITLREAELELDKRSLPKGTFSLRKHLRATFPLENIGNLPASDVAVHAQLAAADDAVTIFQTQPQAWLDKGAKLFLPVDLYFPLDMKIPRFLNFVFTVSYQSLQGTDFASEFRIAFDSERNTWLHVGKGPWPRES